MRETTLDADRIANNKVKSTHIHASKDRQKLLSVTVVWRGAVLQVLWQLLTDSKAFVLYAMLRMCLMGARSVCTRTMCMRAEMTALVHQSWDCFVATRSLSK